MIKAASTTAASRAAVRAVIKPEFIKATAIAAAVRRISSPPRVVGSGKNLIRDGPRFSV